MIKVELPDEAFWAAVGFCVLAVLTSAFRYVKWQSTVLTKKEHAGICENNQKKIESGQVEIKDILKDQNTSAAEYRRVTTAAMETIQSNIGTLKTDVAVLKATRPNGGLLER